MARVRTVVNDVERKRLARTPAYVEALDRGAADRIYRRAVQEAPRSRAGSHGRAPGELVRSIIKQEVTTPRGVVLRVRARVRSPRGFWYGSYIQKRAPYIRPLGR